MIEVKTTVSMESKLDSLTLRLRELPEDSPMGSDEPCWLEIHVINKTTNKAMKVFKKEYPFSKAYTIAMGVCSTPNLLPKGTIVCCFRNSKDKLYDYALISENR